MPPVIGAAGAGLVVMTGGAWTPANREFGAGASGAAAGRGAATAPDVGKAAARAADGAVTSKAAGSF